MPRSVFFYTKMFLFGDRFKVQYFDDSFVYICQYKCAHSNFKKYCLHKSVCVPKTFYNKIERNSKLICLKKIYKSKYLL